MNLLHLKYVVEVAKTHSITKAAQNLFMGQPNLSKAIKDLEKDIGINIFKRTAKGVEPTPQGSSFLSYAQTILAQIDELESLYKKTDDSTLSFTVSSPRATYASTAFSNFALEFTDKKQLSLQFKETSPLEAINDVINHISSIAIVRFQSIFENYFLSLLNENNLKYEPIWEFKMQVMMNQDHPLATLPSIPYHMLNGHTEIIHGDYNLPSMNLSSIRKDALFESPSKQIVVFDRGTQYDMLRNIPGSYMWVSPIPQDVLSSQGFVTKHTTPASVINKDIIVYHKNSSLDSISQRFIEILKAQANALDSSSNLF